MAKAFRGVLQVLLLLLFEWSTGFARLFECLIPLDHCLGSLLPIGYTMQNAQMSRAVFQLPSVCSTLSQAQACAARYSCNHQPSRERINKYINFFTWLCQQTHVVAISAECWNYPFENDVISCGELHITGPMGTHLNHPYHPCPWVYTEYGELCSRENAREGGMHPGCHKCLHRHNSQVKCSVCRLSFDGVTVNVSHNS